MYAYFVYSNKLGSIAMFQTKWNAIKYSFIFIVIRLLKGEVHRCTISRERRF
jgi:hypothetical protein